MECRGKLILLAIASFVTMGKVASIRLRGLQPRPGWKNPYRLLRDFGPGNPQWAKDKQSPHVDPSLEGVLPIEWVHIPKAGISFLNTLMNIPGVCPGFPKGLHIRSGPESDGMVEMLTEWWNTYTPPANCNKSALDTEENRLSHASLEFSPGYNAGKGRFMTFLRQPEQRMLSDLAYSDRKKLNPPNTPIETLIRQNESPVTKTLTQGFQLNGCEGGYPCQGRRPTSADVQEAKIRLSTGFSFVGITEQWDLSICLFNTMFNQACRPFQFRNAHLNPEKKTQTYDTKALNGWRDPYDNELYELGVDIFEANLKKYNVSESSCEPCWREAGLK